MIAVASKMLILLLISMCMHRIVVDFGHTLRLGLLTVLLVLGLRIHVETLRTNNVICGHSC